MIWTKTDAGRSEIQARKLVNDRAQRNLLLLIDGTKPDAQLLLSVKGVSQGDLESLQALGLIKPASATPQPAAVGQVESAMAIAEPPTPLDYAQFTTALTQLISSELGLRGFPLTLAVDKASSIAELTRVAEKVIAQIRERKGESAAAKARRVLYGV